MDHRMSRCTCNKAPCEYEGPDQDCPAHGDPLLFADENDRLRATIERVRAAAQKAKDSNNAWDLEDLVSVALTEEESSRGR
jgi:hypothetical protein